MDSLSFNAMCENFKNFGEYEAEVRKVLNDMGHKVPAVENIIRKTFDSFDELDVTVRISNFHAALLKVLLTI